MQTVFVQANQSSIDAQIAKIEQASESERYKLVNELKKQIARMLVTQQAKAISRYQEETLSVQQNANIANDIMYNNQRQVEQERQTIVPPVNEQTPTRVPTKTPVPTKQIPNPVQPAKEVPVPTTPAPKLLVKPTYIPAKPKPVYVPPVKKTPKPKPTYTPKPKPV